MKKRKCTLLTVHYSTLWVISSVRYERYLEKGITVHFLLLHLQKCVILNHTSLEIKKKNTTILLSWVFYLWIPLFSLPVCDSGRSSLLKFPCFSTSSLTDAALQASALPLFRSLMKVGATGRAEIHGPHVSLTPESGSSAPGEMHSGLYPTAGRDWRSPL